MSETPTKLYAKLTAIVGKKIAASADWPKNTEKFGNELRRLAPQLRMHGVNVSFERRHEGRIITLKSERAPIVPPEVGRRKPEKIQENIPESPVVPVVGPTRYNILIQNEIRCFFGYADCRTDTL